MELNDNYFCDMCSNMRNIVKNESGTLGFHCKACNSTEDIKDKAVCVYSVSTKKLDKSEFLNTCSHLTHDITLPKITGNENILCPNKECSADSSSITYIKYDDDGMKYLYICDNCGKRWTNQID
jgi:DNA-directed RNA polymerase subunit M/transcription elongation factor TFIIS